MAAIASTVTLGGMLAAVAWTAGPAAAAANPTPSAGARKNATRLPFTISGTASLSVDVGTGNALFTDQLITMPNLVRDLPITLSYNSSVFGTSAPSAVTGTNGSGWVITGFDQRVVGNGDGTATYYGPGGLSGIFTRVTGGFTPPTQYQSDVMGGTTAAGFTIKNAATNEMLTFAGSGTPESGQLIQDTDANGNTTYYQYAPSTGYPLAVVTTRGPSGGRTLNVTTGTGGRIASLSQASGSLSRTISFGYDSGGHLTSVTDTASGVTRFAASYGESAGQVGTITNPAGEVTTLGLTTDGTKVASVSQTNPASDGGAGTSTTRFSYVSSTETQVADPTTNQSMSVASVPNTTYTIDSSTQLVTQTVDPDNNTRSRSYTPDGRLNVLSSTPAAGGSTKYTWTSNSGQSLNQVASPSGASESAAYNNTGASAFEPSSTTDDAGNSLTYSYDAQSGNQTGTSQGTGTSGPTANVAYNTNGTPKSSSSPGAASGVTTTYTYDTNNDGNLYEISPPSGTSLGNRYYAWDGFGRVSVITDGAGNTITYTYDGLDRITKVAYSDGTPSVSYTYNATGQVTKRVDGAGTTTYTYDDLGNLLSTMNTANGNTVSYTYDLNGDLATITDGMGTTTYGYDNAHELTSMTYPVGSTTYTTLFANDANGRRTDVWLQANAGHSTWAAHEHFTYDSSGRIKTVEGQNGPATAPTDVLNETMCYAANSTAPTCSAVSTNDRSNIQWTTDSVSGETNSYTYDSNGRLKSDAVTGGSNPRTYSYTYDAAGNRLTSAVTGSSPASQTLTYNNANQITTAGFTYDAEGNETVNPVRTSVFNAAGQQTSATLASTGVTSQYTYAGTNENELLSETNAPAGQTYTYTYGRPDSNGLPEIDEVQAAVGTGYVLHDPSGEPIMLENPKTAVTCLYLYDGTNNPVAMSTSFDTTSFLLRYDPYGAATRIDSGGGTAYADNPYGFGEGTQDRATGELKFGKRYYSPGNGSWTQQDTLNAPLDPKNADRYVYAADNPTNDRDATGANEFSDFFSDAFSSVENAAETIYDGVTGCLSGLVAVDDTGIGEYATAVAGPAGGIAANVGGCAVGAGSAIAGGGGIGNDNSGD